MSSVFWRPYKEGDTKIVIPSIHEVSDVCQVFLSFYRFEVGFGTVDREFEYHSEKEACEAHDELVSKINEYWKK